MKAIVEFASRYVINEIVILRRKKFKMFRLN